MAAAKAKTAVAETEEVTGEEAEVKGRGARKGVPRPSAVIGDLDFGGVDPDSLKRAASQRKTAWDQTLDKLYDATVAGQVGRDDASELNFVQIGDYTSTQGARSQVKAFKNRGLTDTYEFKVSGNKLFARVIEESD